MARYDEKNIKQDRLVIVTRDKQLVAGTLEHAIDHIVENVLDLSIFDKRYKNDYTGRKAIHPKALLKIILLGYSRGMTSTRPIEQACRENVKFMILAGFQTPDHSTIASFVSSIDREVEGLFTEVLMICESYGLLGGTHFSLDGMKLSSNASKEWSGKFSDLKKKQEALERKLEEAIKEHRETDKESGEKENISWEKRQESKIKKLNKATERIKRFLSESKPRIGSQGKEIQSNATDNDSAKIAATSHGVLQGYNANAMVDEKNQVIVHAEAFGKGEDSSLMEPMLKGAKENLEAVGIKDPLKDKAVSADTGYFSAKNLKACKEYEVDAYVPDPKFRKRDIRFADAERHRRSVDKRHEKYKSKKRWFSVDDFNYDDETGKLICPAGHELYVRSRNYVNNDGYKGIIYQAPKKVCIACELRAKCLRKPDKTESRQVTIIYGKRPGSITDEMKNKIDTPEGRKMYSKRLGIVEPVFGNIRACKKMNRFTLRGKIKVNIQWMLYCLVHNIEKISKYGMASPQGA
jgi:transposase